MNVLKSHNDYKAKPQIKKALTYYKNNILHYDALMLEADVICLFGKYILAHSKTYNPLKWYGTLDKYIDKMKKYKQRLVQIEFKHDDWRCVNKALSVAKENPCIKFVWLYNSPHLDESFIRYASGVVSGSKCPNIINAAEYYADHFVASKDFY